MKAVICAIAKCENEYINNWVNYHLNLGFDEIYLFDNNDADYEPVENRIHINPEYKGRVIIQKIPGVRRWKSSDKFGFQAKLYTYFYKNHKNKFDWCAFIDIDEFITLEKWPDIKSFLSDPMFKGYPVIRLNWHMYGDDDMVARDVSVPVWQAITHRLKGHRYEHDGKEIVRGGLSNVSIASCHYCTIRNCIPKQIMPNGKTTKAKGSCTGETYNNLPNCEEAYIRHYMTKTLDEFINSKLQRGSDAVFLDKKIDFDYFWQVNKKTPEKLEYIKQWRES